MPEISTTGDQMLNVLAAIARQGPVTTTEVATHLGINRTVAHRLIATLHRRAFLRRQGNAYVVGPMVVRLARSVEPDLREVAMPVMARLADEVEETVVLHSIDGIDAVVTDQVVSERHVLRVQHQPGSRHRLGVGASGRALLAFQPDHLLERALRTLDDPAAVRRQLQQVRRDGYATSGNELQAGVHGTAAPILGPDGFARASVALLAPVDRAGGLDPHAGRLMESARRIAASLAAVRG